MAGSKPSTASRIPVLDEALADAPELADLSGAARRILTVSASVFAERGAAATSVRDLTRACGLSPGALYNHFASKDDLLHLLVGLGHSTLERRLDAALQQAGADPVERYTAFVRAYVAAHLERPALAQLVRREYQHLSPDRRDEVVARRRKLRSRLGSLLAAGERAGAFHLLGGADRATRTAVMVLDMCSRTSEWYRPDSAGPAGLASLAERYAQAALRIAGAA